MHGVRSDLRWPPFQVCQSGGKQRARAAGSGGCCCPDGRGYWLHVLDALGGADLLLGITIGHIQAFIELYAFIEL